MSYKLAPPIETVDSGEEYDTLYLEFSMTLIEYLTKHKYESWRCDIWGDVLGGSKKGHMTESRVCINSQKSGCQSVSSGVRRCSVLGPCFIYLFIFYNILK